MNVADSVFLLTGCASGIGRHLGRRLAERGACALLTDVDEPGLKETVAGVPGSGDRIRQRRLDVRDPAQWQAAVDACIEAWGRLDVLINVAGIAEACFGHEIDLALIDKHLDINTKGVMYGSAIAARHMAQRRNGHIINFASLAGLIPVPGASLYVASKFAVRGFSLSLGADLAQFGVAVTVVCPDAVETPMLVKEATQPAASTSFSGGRFLQVEDIERVVFDQVLPKRPREVVVPSSMAPLARMLTAWPGVGMPLLSYFQRKGAEKQRAYRERLEREGRGG
jgi:3-oxoacyl-[acyl-carrier protein] reductase